MSSLDSSYVLPTGLPDHNSVRFEDLKKSFKVSYGHEPTFIARASGRVNLIGEHIDYCGYSVLPMAIEQDVLAAFSVRDDSILHLANTNQDYKSFKCDMTQINIDKNNPQWEKYFLCGVKGVLEHSEVHVPSGINCLVDGTIPKCAGLSSSSALVCCAALVTMQTNNQKMTRTALSDVCAHCERYIGTEGGGMDQAICFLAKPGIAKLIDFKPLKTTDVCLPEGAVFVISNSCVEMNKANTAHFNARVVEGRLASQVIAKNKGLAWKDLRRLKDLQVELGIKLRDMSDVIRSILHPAPYTREELCSILDVSDEELVQTSLSANTVEMQNFKLYDRALHVFGEADRVYRFKEICDAKPENALEALGQLMTESHISCRDLYECSCLELDQLVEICLNSGALGSRLTGAGWGGCAVSLVPDDRVTAFISQVTSLYYNDASKASKLSESLFVTAPGGGAAIYKL